ncbi:MAG: CmcI family methyltransferase [Pirellulales bacterium]
MEDRLDMPLGAVLETMQKRLKERSSYFGIRTLKCPTDFWIYQEILFAQKPDVIIEIGNLCGGSTLAPAHFCDNLGHGRVIGCDLSHDKVPELVRRHPRITLFEGDACRNFAKVTAGIPQGANVLVIEDSAHTYDNTLNVLRTYSPLIPVGGYFIVEDSNCHHGLPTGPQPGAYEAIETFTAENTAFVSDRTQESFLITWNPKGFLKRVK